MYSQGESPLDEFCGKCGKEILMDEIMTDYQFKTILKMVLDILSSSKDIEDAKAKIEKLLQEK